MLWFIVCHILTEVLLFALGNLPRVRKGHSRKKDVISASVNTSEMAYFAKKFDLDWSKKESKFEIQKQ